jgi:N-acetyl-anhydromuramyl-L-alanine amidase AmpD
VIGRVLGLVLTLVVASTVAGVPPAVAHAPHTGVVRPAPECPPDLACRFVPAAYAWNDHADPNSYGNYDPADRPADGDRIRYIVIHDTEESYDAAIAAYRKPRTLLSAHYVIRSRDGAITQMVRTGDVAWHSANWNVNQTSIGIEHEGLARAGATWYTEAMYQASARLVRYLAGKYHIPLDRAHILGHDDIQRWKLAHAADAHWDPGPFWDWKHYMDLLGAPLRTEAGPIRTGDVVTITPDFATNRHALRTCKPAPCRRLPAQGTNFTYLSTEPRAGAKLLGDPYLQPGGAPGGRKAEDWSDKAVAGRQYVVAGVRAGWIGLWFAGKRGWIDDPDHAIVRRSQVQPRKVTPARGLDAIPVYNRAFPNADVYPAGVKPEVGLQLPYRVRKGQQYVVGEVVPAAYYYARFDGAHVPLNHTLLLGATKYLSISLNHRWAYVKASDVRNV